MEGPAAEEGKVLQSPKMARSLLPQCDTVSLLGRLTHHVVSLPEAGGAWGCPAV